MRWTPHEQGQLLSFEERRSLLETAFTRIGEEAFLEEVMERQAGKL